MPETNRHKNSEGSTLDWRLIIFSDWWWCFWCFGSSCINSCHSIRIYPPPSNSHHLDYYISSHGNPTKNLYFPLASWVDDRSTISYSSSKRFMMLLFQLSETMRPWRNKNIIVLGCVGTLQTSNLSMQTTYQPDWLDFSPSIRSISEIILLLEAVNFLSDVKH